MNNSSAFMENLRQLFTECDRDQSGSLGRDEFKELCKRIGLNTEAAEETFERLDSDKNQQITFDEFVAGFQQYTRQSGPSLGPSASSAPAAPTSSPSTASARNSSWSPSSPTPGARSRPRPRPPAAGAPDWSGVSSVAGDLQPGTSGSPEQQQQQQQSAPEVVVYSGGDLLLNHSGQTNELASGSGQFGSLLSNSSSSAANFNQVKTMQDLLECVQKLQNENQILTQIFFKDKREREEYISQLGEEFDQQLKEVEERAQRRAKEELEQEKRRLREMMQTERETLEQHYHTLERVAELVKSPGELDAHMNGTPSAATAAAQGDSIEKVKSQLEDTFTENRQLRRSLLDTKTDVALIWKEMEKLKRQYEDKLSSAYEKHRETQNECDHIKQQLSLMKDSNRKLQDASDVIANYITDRVEPVIKVASGCNLSERGDDGTEMMRGASAANSRRGSILSEYLNGPPSSGDDDNKESDDDSRPTSLTKRRADRAMPAKQWAASLKVPEVASSTQLAPRREAPVASATKQVPTSDNSSSISGAELPDKQPKELPLATPPADKEQQPSTTTRSSIKNFGRNLLLGARSSSDAKGTTTELPGHDKSLLAGAKSASVGRVADDEPLVGPADGPSKATFNIILVGDSFVGKSSFAARFIEGNFVQGLISNCSIDFKTKSYKVDGQNYTVNLWDTAGQERFRSITASYFRKADGIILMYDVTDKRSYLNVRNWMSTISDTAAENVAVLLVGNKIDLRRNDNKAKCVPTEEGQRLAHEYGIVFLETSVKTGTNLLPSMGRLIKSIAKSVTAEEEDKDRIRLSDKNKTFNCMPKNC